AFGADDAGRRVEPLHIRRTGPVRLADFVEPGVERGLDRRLVLLPREAVDELPQGASGNDPHSVPISRDQNGHKKNMRMPRRGCRDEAMTDVRGALIAYPSGASSGMSPACQSEANFDPSSACNFDPRV